MLEFLQDHYPAMIGGAMVVLAIKLIGYFAPKK